ncbi:hypothetical protein EYF80_009750 [Liparis tanakae]|uniref:Uncharacterized protein n=1 Tax=Liparis tanakae TaxID=230148 RepID=A0A4Z2IPV8_9TELE|nr:hypothetical protein EYF80_009750 [Liparis tanakae]
MELLSAQSEQLGLFQLLLQWTHGSSLVSLSSSPLEMVWLGVGATMVLETELIQYLCQILTNLFGAHGVGGGLLRGYNRRHQADRDSASMEGGTALDGERPVVVELEEGVWRKKEKEEHN